MTPFSFDPRTRIPYSLLNRPLDHQLLSSRAISETFRSTLDQVTTNLVWKHLVLLAIRHGQPQHKVDNNRRKQRQRKNGRTKPIIKAALAPHPYAFRAPVECEQGVDHGHHRDQREQACADLSDLVAEVEQPNGEAAQDDGEVQP